MTDNGIPARWVEVMEAAGFSSIRQLAKRAGVSVSGTANIVNRLYDPRPSTLAKLAAALRISEAELHQLIYETDARIEPFVPPAGSENLSQRQRRAVTEVILTFLEDNSGKQQGEKKTEPAPADAMGDDPGPEEKTPDGLTKANFDLVARKSGNKFGKK